MHGMVALGYGLSELPVRLPAGADVVLPPTSPTPVEVRDAIERALDNPVDAPRLEELVRAGQRVLLVVSDQTRADPRAEFFEAVRRRLPPGVQLSIAVATGTHGPANVDDLGLAAARRAGVSLVNHDGGAEKSWLDLGTTRRGTPLLINSSVGQCDLIIATGCIRPHYFAGFGGGVKAIFPGLAESRAARINHRLKADPASAAGRIEGNPTRADLEEIVGRLPCRSYLINTVLDAAGGCQGAVAGDLLTAFARGAQLALPHVRVRAAPADLVIVSDRAPVTASLYQASKLVAAVAAVTRPGGTVVLAAQCQDGLGPVDTVNRAIYELGIRPRLPDPHQVILVSDLSEREVAASYCQWAPSVDSVLDQFRGRVLVLPRAGGLVVEATGSHR